MVAGHLSISGTRTSTKKIAKIVGTLLFGAVGVVVQLKDALNTV